MLVDSWMVVDMRDSMVFYRSFFEAVKTLPPEQFKAAVMAIMGYGFDDIEPGTEGIERTIFLLVKPQIDANNRKYQNGTKGGRPRTSGEPNKNQNKTKCKPSNNQTETKPKPNVNDNVNDNVNVNDKKYCVHFERIWQMYPRKKEKAAAYKAYKARLSDGFSEDELETAVKRYADDCKRLHTEERYIKHAATFLGPNTPFADYLKGDGNGPITRNGQPDTGGTEKYNDDYLEGAGEGFAGF